MINVTMLFIENSLRIIVLLIGIGYAYAGFALYRLFLWISGFITGAWISGFLTLTLLLNQVAQSSGTLGLWYVLNNPGSRLDIVVIVLLVSILGGLFGAGLFLILEKVIVFIAGFVSAGFIGVLLGIDSAIVLFFVGVIGAIVAWTLYVYGIILITAVVGALLVELSFSGFGVFGLTFWFVFLTGMLVQGLTVRDVDFEEDSSDGSSPSSSARVSSSRSSGSNLVGSPLDNFTARKRYDPSSSHSSNQREVTLGDSFVKCDRCGDTNNVKSTRCVNCGARL